MQSVQWSLTESETPQRQTTEPTRSAASVPEKLASSEKEQSDRQAAAESMHAAFVWLFGPGCI
jgi:hypothetical protein